MSALGAQVAEKDDSAVDLPLEPRRPWHPLARIGFRFCFTYFTLFCLLFAQILFVFAGIAIAVLPDDAVAWQMNQVAPVAEWLGEHVFGVEAVLQSNGSGDQAAIWMMVFGMLVLAAVLTLIWTLVSRRTEYRTLSTWFVTAIRLCAGGQLLWYGFAKLIPNQMPYPTLTTMLQPYGNFTKIDVLWNQVGVSPVYQVLLGAAEVLAGLLLFLPRTATLGGMLGLISMLQVFLLNMTYDVPVKILAFHLVLMALIVLAPQTRRILDFLVLQRNTAPATQRPLFRTRRANRLAAVAQVALGLWATTACLHDAHQIWYEYGYGAPKPALYGIWNVTEFSRDGQPLPPLTTDENRWQRLVFDQGFITRQRMDGTLVPSTGAVDTAARTVTLTAPPQSADAAPVPFAQLTFEEPAPDRLVLRGEVDGHPVTVSLQKQDLDAFRLRGPGFHWVQNAPALG
ncbi:DoxX family protein [Nocardia sp. NPDC050712]|uniref:DoxX family protein n=1 Tax=Nocardia sp. NPDC050712 TaxID=3155518 RepID=UPI0033EA976B